MDGAEDTTSYTATSKAITYGANETENIDYKSLAVSTTFGSTAGAISGGLGTISIGSSIGAMVVNKAIQVGANTILSNTLYLGQSVVSGNPATAEGFMTATLGGIISGFTYNLDLPRSIAISGGIEFAGYPNEIAEICKKLFKTRKKLN